jgi:hypothetical protein
MRNRWFPSRIADYIPAIQLKQLKAQGVEMARDFGFGVQAPLEEMEDHESESPKSSKPYVRPIELELLSVCPLCLLFHGIY